MMILIIVIVCIVILVIRERDDSYTEEELKAKQARIRQIRERSSQPGYQHIKRKSRNIKSSTSPFDKDSFFVDFQPVFKDPFFDTYSGYVNGEYRTFSKNFFSNNITDLSTGDVYYELDGDFYKF